MILELLYYDQEFEEATLAEVTTCQGGHIIRREDSGSLMVESGPIVPEAGMTAKFYGRGFGYPVRGLVIDGHTFFYRTAEQEHELHQANAAKLNQERAAIYARTKGELAERLSVYPDVFRRRIHRFLANSPTAWEHQAYEMVVCDAALLIIDTYPDAASFQAWRDNDFETPIMESFEMGLSGNQWDMARRLAFWWHVDRENIYRDHAAISLLIGCEEAGCLPIEDSALSHNFPEPPAHLRPSFGNAGTARRALEQGEVICALKLRGYPAENSLLMMLSGDRGEALAFAKRYKHVYTVVCNLKGLDDA